MYKSLSPVLYYLYQFFKGLVLFSFRIFFSRIVVRGKEHLHLDGPAILVCNHPNTLMDPLNAASRINKVVYFLANAGLFKHPLLGRVLRKLYCIPVERPVDVQGRRISNEKSFEKCYDFMDEGGCLFIAPQGGSKMRRHIGQLKTGTARIALGAESRNDFGLGVVILPVGLHYSSPQEFRSKVLINGGEPIQLADYKEIYHEHPQQAVRKLTQDIKDRMGSLVIDAEDDDAEQVLDQILSLEGAGRPQTFEQAFDVGQKLAIRTAAWKEKSAAAYDRFRDAGQSYFDELTGSGLSDSVFVSLQKESESSVAIRSLLALVLLPLFAFCWLHHALANGLPWLLVKKLNLYKGYASNVKVLSGVFTYPIFYGLQLWLVHRLGGNGLITLAYFGFLLASGAFVSWYMTDVPALLAERRARRWARVNPGPFERLKEQRRKLVTQLQ
ncbi:MAG: lysophospholipid acyltransferase family protein, partial [Bacteroidota bacterium]